MSIEMQLFVGQAVSVLRKTTVAIKAGKPLKRRPGIACAAIAASVLILIAGTANAAQNAAPNPVPKTAQNTAQSTPQNIPVQGNSGAAVPAAYGDANATAPNTRQDLAALPAVAERFLQIEAAGLPGKVTVELGRIDPRMNLGACFEPEAFLPKGNRVWGKTTVGIRCTAPSTWVVYLQATVRVRGDYYVAAVPLAQGQMVGANDLVKMTGDLTVLPNGIVTDPSQAVGRTTILSLKMGTALRQDGLRVQNAVQQGQSVRIIGVGPGFQVSTEGHALNNAADGQPAQARTSTGQVVSGIARPGGVIEINY